MFYLVTKEAIVKLDNPFGCEKSRTPLFTYPFFGEDQLISLTIPIGTSNDTLDSLEIVMCVETSLSIGGVACYLGVNNEAILGDARGIIEAKLQEMTSDPIKFYHSWSEYQDHVKEYSNVPDLDGDIVTLTNHKDLLQIYGRIQLLLPFFIEAATPINLKDSKWCVYLCGRCNDSGQEITGLLTAYRYFKFPEGSRVRISQVLIFPRFQGSKLGQALYGNVTQELRGMEDCVEICVEDPTDKFERIRSAVDWRSARDLGIWAAANDNGDKNSDNVLANNTTVSRLRKELKLSEDQAERIYNLNCSISLNPTTASTNATKKPKLLQDPAQTALRLQVKRWLLKKYRKELPEAKEDRIGKLAELYEVEREEFLVPLIDELV